MKEEAAWTGLLSLGLAVFGKVLAQAGSSPTDITAVVGNLGAIGAVILLFWHTQTKVLPALQAAQQAAALEARQSAEKTAAEFRLQLATMMADHRAEMASVRDWHERAIVRMDANFLSLNGTIQSFLKAQEIGRENAVARIMASIQGPCEEGN
jgi:hypothetical protein